MSRPIGELNGSRLNPNPKYNDDEKEVLAKLAESGVIIDDGKFGGFVPGSPGAATWNDRLESFESKQIINASYNARANEVSFTFARNSQGLYDVFVVNLQRARSAGGSNVPQEGTFESGPSRPQVDGEFTGSTGTAPEGSPHISMS